MIRKLNSINILIIAFAINLYLIIVFCPAQFSPGIFVDTGVMSVLNMILILTVWVLILLHFINNPEQRLHWFCWLYIVQVYLFREADFHRAFFDEHVTRPSFYTMAQIPLWQKIIGGVIMSGFFATSIYTFLSNARRFMAALVIREPWAISLVLWFVFLLLSQVYDKTLGYENPNWKLSSIEEMLEVTAALYAVSAISLFSFKQWSDRNNKISAVESDKK
ncbi:MAG: hypothetical protein ACYSR1_01230 [Planctomycetota bacterium]|jgi:hypothetical protein